MQKSIKTRLKDTTEMILAELNDCFKVVAVEVLPSERENHIKDYPVKVVLCIESFFPREVLCQRACISLEEQDPKRPERRPQEKTNKTELSNVNNSNVSQASPVKRNVSIVQNNVEVVEEEYISRSVIAWQ